MNGYVNELDYRNVVMRELERDALYAPRARLAQGGKSTPLRHIVIRIASAIGTLLIAIGGRIARASTVGGGAPAGA